MKLRKLIEDYLEKSRMMQIATSKNAQPWVCTVYFTFDEDLNLYWISHPTRRHSEELRKNPKVAGTIVLPHTPGDDVRGLQFQGRAKELTTKKLAEKALKYYATRYNLPTTQVNAILNNEDSHLCYRIKPSLFVLFDEVNYPKQPRQEYKL